MKKARLIYSLFFFLALFFLFLMVSGCSESESSVADPYPEMTHKLRTLQGTWTAASTNSCSEGGAIIDGYTVRIRYQQNTNSPLFKHNASIDRVDAERQLLILNGGTGAWPFYHRTQEGKELLDIEFFSQSGWNKVNLQRDPG